jgi:Transcriptional regulator LmrA/YxaF-like, C-terminal domain
MRRPPLIALLDSAARALGRRRDAFVDRLRGAGVPRARADRLAALVVSAVEGAIILSRAERHPAPPLDVARELEAVIEAALD